MKNILVPLGSSGNGPNTLQYAINFAQAFGAKVYVTKIYESTRIAGSLKNVDALLEEETIKDLQSVVNEVDTKDVEVATAAIKGQLTGSLEALAQHIEADLIVISAKSISTDESLFLGKVSGSIVKDTIIPVLIVPSQYRYKAYTKILMAVKSGNLKSNKSLKPLKEILNKFSSELNLIQLFTPRSTNEDKDINQELKALSSSFKTTENATVFQGVLEHLHGAEPDLLCVMRRPRGFFTRLWQEDTVKKKDFESRIPLLVLKGIS